MPWPEPPQTDIAPTLYIGQPLNLAPLEAQAAFDLHRIASSGTRGAWVVKTDQALLVAQGAGGVQRRHPVDAYRRWYASLRPLGWPASVGVELELSPASSTRCELGLRPSGRTIPLRTCRRHQQYFEGGIDILAKIAETVQSSAIHLRIRP